MGLIYMKIKVVTGILLIFIILFGIFSVSYADQGYTKNPQYTIDPDLFNPNDNASDGDYSVTMDKVSNIISVIMSVGIIFSVVMIMVLGIRYMFGSVEQKAEYKRTMIPFIIGAVMLFAITSIIKLIISIIPNS